MISIIFAYYDHRYLQYGITDRTMKYISDPQVNTGSPRDLLSNLIRLRVIFIAGHSITLVNKYFTQFLVEGEGCKLQ